MLPLGYTLYCGMSRFSPLRRCVVIATGFRRPTANSKTGSVIQVWILDPDIHPAQARRTADDRPICGTCPLAANNGCYVTMMAPGQVWRSYHAGAYPSTWPNLTGRTVRFGAYGDPAAVPLHVWKKLARQAQAHFGYTHHWPYLRSETWAPYVMASCETLDQARQARSLGWSTFRVTSEPTKTDPREILCLNTSRGLQCTDCGICHGTPVNHQPIGITIAPHGSTAVLYHWPDGT